MPKLNVDHTFVVHVSQGAEDREKFIMDQLQKHGIDFEFMLRGDLGEITPEIQGSYFAGHMNEKLYPAVSCALKHIYILEEIVSKKIERALILEDDISLNKNFVELCNRGLQELDDRDDLNPMNYFISLEDNRNYISKSEEKKGQMLYEKDRSRYAGAYIISKDAAKIILEEISKRKCHRHIDWYYAVLCQQGKFPIYWMHPTIAEQGSHSGQFSSLLDNKPSGILRKINWKIQTVFKKQIRRKFK